MIKNKDKVITGIISICLVFMVFGIGYFGIQSVGSSLSGSNNYQSQNVTSSFSSANSILLPLMIIGVISLVVGILFYSVSSTNRFSRFGKIITFLIKTSYYFGYGMIFIVILAVPSYFVYLLYNFAIVEGNTVVTYETLKWIVLLTLAFFAIGGLGYVFKKYFVDRLKNRLNERDHKAEPEGN